MLRSRLFRYERLHSLGQSRRASESVPPIFSCAESKHASRSSRHPTSGRGIRSGSVDFNQQQQQSRGPPSLPKGVDALGGNLLWPRGACLSPGKNSSRAKQKIKCGLRLERDLDSACVLPRWTSSVHFGFAPPVMVSPLIAFHRPLTCT